MLASVLSCHSSIFAIHEPRPTLIQVGYAKERGSRSAKELVAQIEKKRSWLTGQVLRNGLVYVESSGFLSNIIDELKSIYDAKFIHLHRSGLHFVRSGLEREWFVDGPNRFKDTSSLVARIRSMERKIIRRRYLVDLGDKWDERKYVPARLDIETDLQKTAWLWMKRNLDIVTSFESLPSEDTLSVALESFDVETLRRILDFIGVEASHELEQEMMRVAERRPNKSGSYSVPAPTQWSEEQMQEFREVAGDMMVRLGYWA